MKTFNSLRSSLEEKKLTPAEMKKREEVAKAIERENPNMPMGMKMAIATKTAKRVAEEADDEGRMARGQLNRMINQASGLVRVMDDYKQLDGWVQSKLTMASDYLDSVHDYLMHNKQDVDEKEDELEEAAWGRDKAANLKAALDRHSEKAVAANKAGDHEAVKVHQSKMNMIKNQMSKLVKEEELDELNQMTLQRYASKAYKVGMTGGPKSAKHLAGAQRAKEKLKYGDYSEEVEQVDEVVKQAHKVMVTVSEPDHPMVSKRKETIMKRVVVHATDKGEAKAKAESFYKKKGYKVHGSEYHSVQPASTLKTEETLDEVSKKTAVSYIQKKVSQIAKRPGEAMLYTTKMTGKDYENLKRAYKRAGVKEEVEIFEGYAEEDIANGGTVIYKHQGKHYMSKVSHKTGGGAGTKIHTTSSLGHVVPLHNVVSTDASDWSRFKNAIVKEEVKDEYARKVNKYLKKKYNKEEFELDEATQFPSKEHAISYAKEKVKSHKDSDDGIEVYSMPGGGARVVHTMNSQGRQQVLKGGGKKVTTVTREQVEIDEAGPFSYGAKPPKKGSVAYNAMMKRKEQDNKPPIEPKDQMVGVAKLRKEETELDETKSAPKGFHFTKDGKLKRGDADQDGPGGPMLRSDPLDKQRSKVPPVSEDQHYCAKHVYSNVYGEGVVLEGQHADPDENGNIEWYVVNFAEGPKKVYTEKLDIMIAEYHGNHKKKRMTNG
jgi:hypothetical protein